MWRKQGERIIRDSWGSDLTCHPTSSPSTEQLPSPKFDSHIPSNTYSNYRFSHTSSDSVYMPSHWIQFVLVPRVPRPPSNSLAIEYQWRFYGLCFLGRRGGRLCQRRLYGSRFDRLRGMSGRSLRGQLHGLQGLQPVVRKVRSMRKGK